MKFKDCVKVGAGFYVGYMFMRALDKILCKAYCDYKQEMNEKDTQQKDESEQNA